MPKWLVSLQGDSVDLQELADEFRSAHLSVRKEQGRYFLRASQHFDALTRSDKVRDRATELLPLLVGTIKLRTGYAAAITLGDLTIRVEDDGTGSTYTHLETLRVRPKTPEVSVSSGPRNSAPPLAERWVDLALRDEKVLDALRFFQEETTWWSLRKTYEVIETELQLSKIAKLGWASVPEIKRFKEWAGYYVHGEQQGYPNEDYHPYLPLPEAESFMQQMLLKWLQRKLENP
jgi:hypothetical protein